MPTEVLVILGCSGAIALLVLKQLSSIIKDFILLTENLASLIEVTYKATHDPDVDNKLRKTFLEEK